jgi:outer membrane cobalamin receptor
MWEGNVGQHQAAVSGRAANIWGEEYSVIAGRPMPGQHFMLTARFGIF